MHLTSVVGQCLATSYPLEGNVLPFVGVMSYEVLPVVGVVFHEVLPGGGQCLATFYPVVGNVL